MIRKSEFYFDPASIQCQVEICIKIHTRQRILIHTKIDCTKTKLQINNYDTGTYMTSDLYISHHHVKTQQ